VKPKLKLTTKIFWGLLEQVLLQTRCLINRIKAQNGKAKKQNPDSRLSTAHRYDVDKKCTKTHATLTL